LKLEQELNHTTSKLCILGLEPLKESLNARILPITLRLFRIPP
jgi:hypothetical protein